MASPKQKKTVERVMHAFKEGDLESGTGKTVKSRKQAVAIALSESGQSRTKRATAKSGSSRSRAKKKS